MTNHVISWQIRWSQWPIMWSQWLTMWSRWLVIYHTQMHLYSAQSGWPWRTRQTFRTLKGTEQNRKQWSMFACMSASNHHAGSHTCKPFLPCFPGSPKGPCKNKQRPTIASFIPGSEHWHTISLAQHIALLVDSTSLCASLHQKQETLGVRLP